MKNVTHPPTVLLPVMSETHQNPKYLAMFEAGNPSTLRVDFFFPHFFNLHWKLFSTVGVIYKTTQTRDSITSSHRCTFLSQQTE